MADCFERGAVRPQGCRPPAGGTILSVADAAARAGRVAADAGASIVEVAEAARDAASAALLRTPEQLPALAAAGWSTPAGPGACCSWRRCAASSRATGPRPTCSGVTKGPARRGGDRRSTASPGRSTPAPTPCSATVHWPSSHPGGPGRPGLRGDVPRRGQRRDSIDALTATLDRLGTRSSSAAAPTCGASTSMSTTWGAAIEAGIDAGRLRRILVTNFADQIARRRERQALGIVACAGAGHRLHPPGGRRSRRRLGPRRPSLRRTTPRCRPGHRRPRRPHPPQRQGHRARGRGGRDRGRPRGPLCSRHPSRTAVQGLAAMAVLDPAASVQDNVVAMAGAAGRPARRRDDCRQGRR